MVGLQPESVAKEVLTLLGNLDGPTDLFSILAEEGIALAPGNYGPAFNGRIEYHPDVNRFIVFYPGSEGAPISPRVRFSLAHELGHYYLPHHYQSLLGGGAHNSLSGFICDAAMEREADAFAAALLIPDHQITRRLNAEKFLTLKKILAMARDTQASATCAAIRYCKFAEEACAIVLSQGKQVKFYIPSQKANERGFGGLGKKVVPLGSPTATAAQTLGETEPLSAEIDSKKWFSERRAQATLWEEAIPLGYTDLVLTLLAFDS